MLQEATQRAQELVESICASRTDKELYNLVPLFDRLSDTVCRVLDLCEFIRGVHPDEHYVSMAEEVYGQLFSYMNVLNTHVGLYDALCRLKSTPTVWDALGEEERAVALIFLRDFHKSGIQLSERKRASFIQLSDEVQSLSRHFLTMQEQEDRPSLVLPDAALPVHPLPGVKRKDGQVHIQASPRNVQFLLQHCPFPSARKAIYRAAYTASDSDVSVLDSLVDRRHQLAQAVDFSSYGEMFLSDKMAQSPEKVEAFIQALSRRNTSVVQGDMALLGQVRQQDSRATKEGELAAWDRAYYHRLLRASSPPLSSLTPYFPLARVLQGLSRLVHVLYGVRLRPSQHAQGEVWAEGVRRMEVADENGTLLGLIYLDLEDRPGKFRGAAHYTIRCSRRLWPEEGKGLQEGTVQRGSTKWVTPMVVLTCGFSQAHKGMEIGEVETLFHEAGHALHAMLGQTTYHNVAGTRCAVDFVELPSILHERFISDPSFLRLLSQHHRTGSPAPLSLIQSHLSHRQALSSLEDQQQMVYAMLDQRLHASRQQHHGGSDEAVREAESLVGAFPHVPGARWQMDFGHLVGYGAGYYSYLLDRVLANRVWQRVFRSSGVSRESGEKLASSVLRHGGGRDPWTCVEDLLQEECSMATVGTWGLHGDDLG
ncbi:MAG: metallopeptidase [Piptocephalis tieghemiana]|nr:MAG: metallopeptidase [Piptocephalis tieghemiana]